MSTVAPNAPKVLRRDRAHGWLGGVCAGIARRYGLDVWLVRFAFVVATVAGGIGLVLYPLAWLLIPPGTPRPPRRDARHGAAPPSRWRSGPACCS